MATIDPFTTDGAKRITEITGQQPAPVSASVLSAPSVPNLPQPTYTPLPAAPSVPSLDEIFNTPDTPLDKQFQDATQKEGDLGASLAEKPAYQTAQEQTYDIAGKKKTVNDLTTQLNNLQAEANQIPLSVQNEFEGRGATTGGVAPIQSGLLRNNTIRQLGVSAMLNAANGNLASAQDQVDAAVKAKFDPIESELNAQKAQLEALMPLMDSEQKKQAAKQQAQLQERSDALQQQRNDQKAIYDTMLTAAQYGADSVTLRNIQNASTPAEATQAASIFLGRKYLDDKAQQDFDNNIKLAQLSIDQAKLRNDTAAAAASADPSQILAYAQQYAADGKIPTGLPKGSFGIVAQVAKEMPKPEGTLVSNATGVSPTTLSGTQMDGIVALRDLQTKLDDAKTLFDSYNHGILAGVKNALFPSTAAQQYNDLRGEIVDLLARARTGATINAQEEATYLKKLPGNFNKSAFIGASGDTKIEDIKKSLTGKLDTTLQTHNVSIYGYSQVDIGGQPYTVGQIVTNANGQRGRVNADGSITLIQ